jgi:hypothetical protein
MTTRALSFRDGPIPEAQVPRRPPLGNTVNRGYTLYLYPVGQLDGHLARLVGCFGLDRRGTRSSIQARAAVVVAFPTTQGLKVPPAARSGHPPRAAVSRS